MIDIYIYIYINIYIYIILHTYIIHILSYYILEYLRKMAGLHLPRSAELRLASRTLSAGGLGAPSVAETPVMDRARCWCAETNDFY